MPELPDIVVYVEALQKRILNPPLQRVRMAHPFLLRTAEPPLAVVENKRVIELQRVGKRIAIGLEDELWLLIHLMILDDFTGGSRVSVCGAKGISRPLTFRYRGRGPGCCSEKARTFY